MSHVSQHSIDPNRYAKCVEVSKRMRWDAERDVIRGREFDSGRKYVAGAVLAASSWAVLALSLDIELFSQAHYRSSIEPETQLDALWNRDQTNAEHGTRINAALAPIVGAVH